MFKLLILATIIITVACQTPLKPGVPYKGSTPFRSWTYFTIPASYDTVTYVQLIANVDAGIPFFYAAINAPPTLTANIWSYENATGGRNITLYISNPNVDIAERSGNVTTGTLYIGVYGFRETKYTITVNPQECFILKGDPHTYPSLTHNGRSYRFYHAVKRIYHNQTVYDGKLIDGVMVFDHCPKYPRNKVDLSHHCHNKRCANPYHVQFEYTGHNVSRNSCIGKPKCICNMEIKCIVPAKRKVIINKSTKFSRSILKKNYGTIDVNRRKKMFNKQ